MIPPDTESLGWLQALFIGGLGGLLGGVGTLMGWSFMVGRKTQSMEDRLAALEEHRRAHDAHCAKQKGEILEELRRDICNIVKLAIKDLTIDHNKELASLDKRVDMQNQLLESIQGDIETIFGTRDRRDTGHYTEPNQSRRRGDVL